MARNNSMMQLLVENMLNKADETRISKQVAQRLDKIGERVELLITGLNSVAAGGGPPVPLIPVVNIYGVPAFTPIGDAVVPVVK